MPRLDAILASAALAILCGCTPSVGVRPAAPLQIVRTEYLPIPPELVAPCTAPAATIRTWGDLAQAYLTVRAALAGCAAQVDSIAKLQPK